MGIGEVGEWPRIFETRFWDCVRDPLKAVGVCNRAFLMFEPPTDHGRAASSQAQSERRHPTGSAVASLIMLSKDDKG